MHLFIGATVGMDSGERKGRQKEEEQIGKGLKEGESKKENKEEIQGKRDR